MQAEKLKGESFIHDKRTLKAEVVCLFRPTGASADDVV